MKKVFGYLIMIGLLSICWGLAYMMFSQGEITGALVCFGIGACFFIFFVFIIVYANKMSHQHDFTGQDYEVVMTQLDRVEKLGEAYYFVHTKWVDPEGGAEYFFKSGYIDFNPKQLLKGKEIPVKISVEDYRVYAVDLSMLPKKA